MLTCVLPERPQVTPVRVAAVGTLQEPEPVSMVPPLLAKVLTKIPVTGARDIGFVMPETVKLNSPDLAVVNIFDKVNI